MRRVAGFAVGLFLCVETSACVGYPRQQVPLTARVPPPPSGPPGVDPIQARHVKAEHEAPFDIKVAEAHHLAALEEREAASGPKGRLTADSLARVARFYMRSCRFDEAGALQDRANTILQAYPESSEERGVLAADRAYCDLGRGALEEALQRATTSLAWMSDDNQVKPWSILDLYQLEARAGFALSKVPVEITARQSAVDLALRTPELARSRARLIANLHDAYLRTGDEINTEDLVHDYHLVVRSTTGAEPWPPPEADEGACVPQGSRPPAGYVKNAAYTLRQLHEELRVCAREVSGDQDGTRGGVYLVLRIAADGAVQAARVFGLGVRPDALDCTLALARRARFEAPVGGRATFLDSYRIAVP